jgi:hypothetical protein
MPDKVVITGPGSYRDASGARVEIHGRLLSGAWESTTTRHYSDSGDPTLCCPGLSPIVGPWFPASDAAFGWLEEPGARVPLSGDERAELEQELGRLRFQNTQLYSDFCSARRERDGAQEALKVMRVDRDRMADAYGRKIDDLSDALARLVAVERALRGEVGA